jgi:hypothetical protein
MNDLQRIPGKLPNVRYHYTTEQIARFLRQPEKYRGTSKWRGMLIDHEKGELSRHGMKVIPAENIDEFLTDLYKNPKTGFTGGTKMYAYIKRHYIGISRRQVQEWINRNEIEQIHAAPRKQNVARPIVVSKPLAHVQADLTIWEKYRTYNKNYAYILAVVDLNSKYLWMEPVKRKTAVHVNDALVKILAKMPKMPSIFQTDNGGEFQDDFHKTLESRGIKHVFSQSHSPTTQGAIERVQGSIKKRIGKHFTLNKTRVWIDVLPDLVSNYNNTEHSVTKSTPTEMLNGGRTSHETEVIRKTGNKGILKQAAKMIKSNTRRFPQLHVGDAVRLMLTSVDARARARELQGQRHASIEQNWTREIYVIVKIKSSKKHIGAPQSFKVADMKTNKEVDGWFFRDRLKLQESPEMMQMRIATESDDLKKLDDVDEEDEKSDGAAPSTLKERRKKEMDTEDKKQHALKKQALKDKYKGLSLAAGREKRVRFAPKRFSPG